MCTSVCECVWSLCRDSDERGGEGRLLVSDFINEGGNVFIQGLDTPTTFHTNPSCSVCWCVCVCVCKYLNQGLDHSESQQCIFNRGLPAGLPACHPLTGQQPSWRSHSPANTTHALNPQSAPLILMKGGSKDNKERRKRRRKSVVRLLSQSSLRITNYLFLQRCVLLE